MTCEPVGNTKAQIFAPGVIQVAFADVERVLIDLSDMKVVAKCTVTSADIAVRAAIGSGINVVSDSRNVHRGQSLSSGDLSVGTANAGVIIDRGEFNVDDIVDVSIARTLHGSFYVLFFAGAGCQFNLTAIASGAP